MEKEENNDSEKETTENKEANLKRKHLEKDRSDREK